MLYKSLIINCGDSRKVKRLLLANIIWAFSFSLIGHYVSGKVDTYLAIAIRLLLGALIWLPLSFAWKMEKKYALRCFAIGGIQIGLMYIAYYNSFKYLKVVEVALFTVMTPFYISLLGSMMDRKFAANSFLSAALAIFGAIIIKWTDISSDFLIGLLLVQMANASFAMGQVLYKKYVASELPISDQRAGFAYFHLGALVPVLPFLLTRWGGLSFEIPTQTWLTLAWLGIVASGLGYFLWNSGTKLVNMSQLAVMNNVLIPMAILVNLVLWKTQVNWLPFLAGSVIIGIALFLDRGQKVT